MCEKWGHTASQPDCQNPEEPDMHAESYLSVALYDQRESEARIAASYPALRAFSPISFNQVNFPARVTHEAELRRYADIMHEVPSRTEWLNAKLYSREEVGIIRQLSTQIEELT